MGTALARRAMCESAFNLLEPSGSVQACNAIVLPLLLPTNVYDLSQYRISHVQFQWVTSYHIQT